MTLRLRLVLALVALVTVAQGLAFAAIYISYRNSEFDNLNQQLRSSYQTADNQLDDQAGIRHGPLGNGGGQPYGPAGGQGALPPGTFAELLSPTGSVLVSNPYFGGTAPPKLPSDRPAATAGGVIYTAAATKGSGHFRVLEVLDPQGDVTVVAIPTSGVDSALDRLLLIEGVAVGALLAVVATGAWLLLRRGLRPLERMAITAERISGGDMSQRVAPSGGNSEIGQLGLALNTMLDDIEAAFAARHATEQKLRQFLADASHELRTPLTSIQGFAELFRVSGEDARVDLPTILRRIEEEAARMKGLVEDLLLLARLDEHHPLEPRPVDLTVLAADACTDAVATDPSRHVTLDAPDAVVVEAHESHLRQAVANLMSNALRYTPPGSPLDVGCHHSEAGAVLTVRDHGGGLDDESLEHVFDRFWQGDKARVGTGAGLGLSIVSAVAAEHGGSATAANAPGGGAIFTITLPGALPSPTLPAPGT